MHEASLSTVRSRIEALADPGGPYVLVCARTGDRPVPAGDLRFSSRRAASRAAQLTEFYRAAIRRYDPAFRYCDVIVEEDPSRQRVCCSGETASEHHEWSLGDPVLDRTFRDD